MKKIVLAFLLVVALYFSTSSVSANSDSMSCQGYVSVMTVMTSGGECSYNPHPHDCIPKIRHYAGSPYSCSESEMANGTAHTIHHFTRNCIDCRCKASCACAASTPVGSTCGNGCGGSCSGTMSVAGACGSRSKVYSATDTVTTWNANSWCSAGTPAFPNGAISFPNQGEYTAQWSCVGLGGGATASNCRAGRILPAPTVDLKINGSNTTVSVNRDTGGNLDFSWNVVKNTSLSGVNAYCSKNGSTWGTGQIIPPKNLVDSDNDFPLPGVPYPKTNILYSLTCYNGNGNAALNSSSNSETIGATVVCNAADTWSGCPKECGLSTETESCTRTNANCTTSSCGSRSCNYDPCPVSGEMTEVRP